VPWRAAQRAADAETAAGEGERASLVRRVYLYFFLFVAAVTVLASLVTVVYRLLTLGLGGGETHLVSTLASAVANTLIGIGVWVYHLASVRADARTSARENAARGITVRIVILDAGDGHFGRAALERLRRELPDAALLPVGLTPAAAGMLGAGPEALPDALAGATLIIAPWYVVSPDAAAGAVTPDIARAVAASPAQKLLVPLPAPAYAWVGLARWDLELILRQLAQAARAVRDGRPISYTYPMSGCAVIGIIIAILLLLLLLAIPVVAYFLFTAR
ncbi:MAG TPA: DUF3842 family protein, partial [Armatimonadota bacterium]|nr:DUF3842 family protein [Armatimonadota bacterium]